MSLEEYIKHYQYGEYNTPEDSQAATEAIVELDFLRARLKVAEAVIAALPSCEKFINQERGYCEMPATREYCRNSDDGPSYEYWCDEHAAGWADEDTWAADELRAWMALTK